MPKRVALSLAGILLVVIVAAIAFGLRLSRSQQASGPGTSATPLPTNSPSPSPTADWKVYTDSQFGFTISYPSDFVIEKTLNPGGTPPPGMLMTWRAVDSRFAGKSVEPTGQVEFGVYAKDSDTLNAWVEKHTGPCGSPNDKAYYWDRPSNVMLVTAARRDALSFDWNQQACGTPLTPHVTVFFMGRSYIFALDWWSLDAGYLPTVQGIGQQMLASFTG